MDKSNAHNLTDVRSKVVILTDQLCMYGIDKDLKPEFHLFNIFKFKTVFVSNNYVSFLLHCKEKNKKKTVIT